MQIRARRLGLPAALGLALLSAVPATAQRAAAPPLLIRHVTLIDGTGAPPRTGVDVLSRDGRIAAVGEALPDAAAITIDGSGLFLLPGLTDAHVHLSGDTWEETAGQLSRVLRGGVTAVYDVAGDVRQTSDLSRASLAGQIEAPTIYYAALFAGPAFFSDPRVRGASLGFTPGEAPWMRAITPETDLAEAIAQARGAGATSIKLYAALDPETVSRIGAEAARQHVRLIAHATVFPARPSDLVNAGVKYLAHAAYLVWEGSPASDDYTKRARGDFAGVPADGPAIARVLEAMKAHDVALNPTLWIFAEGPAKDDLAGERTPWMYAVTRRAQELGVTIAAGVDTLMTDDDPLPTLHKELEQLVKAGLTPMQAIVAATSGAARGIGVDGARGTVTVGKTADLLLVDRDPSADIRNTRRIRYVIKDGRVVVAAAEAHR
jgi:imidazolonepropionase-like amidohydrolase